MANYHHACELLGYYNNYIICRNIYESSNRWDYVHDFNMLAYVSSGVGIHYINNKPIPIMEGDVFIINPFVEHCFCSSNDEWLKMYYCFFKPDAIPVYYQRIKASFPEFDSFFEHKSMSWIHVKDTSIKELGNLFIQMIDYYTYTPVGYDYLLETTLVQLLHKIYKLYSHSDDLVNSSRPNNIVDHCITQINHELYNKLSLEYLAQSMHVSPGHLNRLFKEHTGKTIIQFINYRRIEKIKYLLINTTRPANLIVEDFSNNPNHIKRIFKQQTGYSMNEYRKKFKI